MMSMYQVLVLLYWTDVINGLNKLLQKQGSIYNYTVTTDNHAIVKEFNEISNWKQYCPSYCDENNDQHPAYNCIHPPHCCKFDFRLLCCNNSSLAIGNDITDGYNCNLPQGQYWQIVLAVCVPLATLSLIAFLSMTSYLMCRKRRERQTRGRQRTGSGSDLSCSSWSVSTVSPNNTIRGGSHSRNPDCTSEHTCSRRQRSHGPPLEIFVLGPLIPPPYVDKPPPYSAVCNRGEPNSGYEEINDVDSLPDYESIIMDPMTLIANNNNVVMAVTGAHRNESQDNQLTAIYETIVEDTVTENVTEIQVERYEIEPDVISTEEQTVEETNVRIEEISEEMDRSNEANDELVVHLCDHSHSES